jgi:drug/metabolite transporter (DMT)-like permease
VLAYVSVACWYFAIFNLPITEVISLSFLTPILTSIFAIILLKERLGFEKLIALLVGFTGTYIMLQPEIKGFNFYILYALAACTIWAISNIIVKNLTATQNPKIIVLNLAIVLMPISLPGFLLNFQIPSLVELGMIVLIAIFSNLAQVFMTTAYQKTRVTVVVPFDFMKLVFTSIIAYLMLGELIEYQTLIGSALILFASYIVIKKEAGKRKK